jgi:MtrB/PioB family decaheme-associated outer membrane protein
MRNLQKHFTARASVLAVHGALLAIMAQPAAAAESDDVAALTQPTNNITIGVGNVDKSSYKFSEYNALDKKGAYGIGGFNVRGSDGYDSGSTASWKLFGNDLGLASRSISAEYGKQGSFRISIGFDGIHRNQYDDFKTIYRGAGTSTLTVDPLLNGANHPAQIGGISTSSSAPANVTTVTNATVANLLANFNNIQAPNRNPGTLTAPNTTPATSALDPNAGMGWLIPAAMQDTKISTERKRTNLAFEVKLTDQWAFSAGAVNATKTGLKLTGVGSVDTGHGVTAPEPIHYTTSLFNAGFNYTGTNSHLTFGYAGSIFRNDVNTWTADSIWTNNAVQGNVNRMIGAPDNQYHQFKATGGYNFSKATKLVVSLSRANSTQNEQFIASGPLWYVPASSANAKVVNTNFLARLTSRWTSNLDVLASVRYEDRDDRTPYMQTIATGRDALGTAATTSPCGPGALPEVAAIKVGGLTCYDNVPINIRQDQVVLEGNYRFARGQAFKFGYEWQKIKRTSDVAGEDPFRADETKENTVRFQYRNTMAENLTGRIGYDRSQRRHSEFELVEPLGGVLGAAVEPMLPNLINYIVANRNRDRLRSSLELQASERTTLTAGLDYNKDKYTDQDAFGKQLAKSWVLNLEGSFAASDNLFLTAYYTYEDQKASTGSLSILRATDIATASTPNPLNAPANCRPYPSTAGYSATGGAISYGSPSDYISDPCRIWNETQADKVNTFGLTFRAKASSKLNLDGIMTYTQAKTPITMSGMQVISNGLTIGAYGNNAAVNNNLFIPVASMPDSKSTMWDFRLGGNYAIDKLSAVRLVYGYRKLTSNNAQWDAYAANPVAIQGFVGTGISSPNYKVNWISAVYIYSFM